VDVPRTVNIRGAHLVLEGEDTRPEVIMLRPWRAPLLALAGQVVLLAALAPTVGLAGPGWAVGLLVGAGTALALTIGQLRTGTPALGPADHITLVRTVLTGGVAALVAAAFVGPPAAGVLVALGTVGVVLDGVDGRVARRTGTASAFGARFDMEADALLVLVLSAHVARDVGPWVLLIGAARYLFVLVGRGLPWLRAPLRPRYWSKVVAVIQAVTLLLAASGLLPPAVAAAALAVALLLLAESFGRDVVWLHRNRPTREPAVAPARQCSTGTEQPPARAREDSA
jgi:phosphatidylglycerophosphate synthase